MLIDRPWDAHESSAAMEAWISRLDELAGRFKGDAEALDDIARERKSAERLLADIKEREAAGLPLRPMTRSDALRERYGV